jgi:two-component system, OmpR family, sensor histidine kinase BaeS
MSHSLQSRLFLNGLIIVLLGMGLAGFLFWQAAENLYINTQKENLLAQAELTAAALQGQSLPVNPVEPYSQLSNVQPGFHTRVLGREGTVVIGLPLAAGGQAVQMPAAEDFAVVSPGDLLLRPEISFARQGKAAVEVRTVLNGQRRVMYAAAPILEDNGSASGLVYLAVPLPKGGLPSGFFIQLVLAGLVAAVLALLAGTLLARRITRPVSAITAGAAAVSEGDLNLAVPARSGIRELDTLGDSFNRMVANLRKSDQAQNAFVADVAHELRTPLTVIKGTVETLEDGAMDDIDGRGPLLASMQRETDRLIRLVNNLLVLTRADAGMLKLNLKPVDMAVLAQQRCDHLSPLAAKKGVKLEIKSEGMPCATGDEDRLSQVLDNLLDNAIRYSPECSVVTVEIAPGEKQVLYCSIHDRGPGIPPEHLPHIFDRFYRAEASRMRQGGEAGLGLAIARALMQAQGGSITAENRTSGGTTLRISLPAARDCPKTDGFLTQS